MAAEIAGHDVYLESTDGGGSWQPVPNDLPGLDLHAFAVDPAHMQLGPVGVHLEERRAIASSSPPSV